jgi:undecaprenyl-diphosphatase
MRFWEGSLLQTAKLVGRRMRQVWRSSPEIQFAIQLVFGVAALMVATALFAKIAEDVVTGDPLVVVDSMITIWIRKHRSASFTKLMWIATGAADPYMLASISTVVGILLFWKRAKYWGLALLLTVPGGLLLNLLLKTMFRRPRPEFNPLLTGYSFPSGHAMSAMLMYGFWAAYVFLQWRSWFWRLVVVVASCLLILLVAMSRVYIEAHYLSDVLGAIAAGFAWLVFSLMAVALLKRKKLKMDPQNSK